MIYALQIRNHEKRRWERAAKDTLFSSQLQAYLWLCNQPDSTRPDTSWGWRVIEATKTQIGRPHKIPMLPEKGSFTAMQAIANDATVCATDGIDPEAIPA